MAGKQTTLEAVKAAQARIIKAGFPYMKFELEAHFWRTSSYNEAACQSFLNKYVGKELRDKVVFQRFYYDGSVDSELTITLKTEDAHHIVKWLEGFNLLGKEIGRGMDVTNAGMHIAVLPESRYPCRLALDPIKQENFRSQVQALMPALILLASHNHKTRRFQFRTPKVSADDKYSAIAMRNNVFEYRIFDTCYDKPEAIYDKIEVIAATLKYYSKQKTKVKIDREIRIVDGGNYKTLFNQPDLLEAMEKSIEYIRPRTKTLAQLKKERGINISSKKFERQKLKAEAEVEIKYKTALTRWETRARIELRQFKLEIKDLKGWKSLEADDDKSIAFLLERGFIPRKPNKETMLAAAIGAQGGRSGGYRIPPTPIGRPSGPGPSVRGMIADQLQQIVRYTTSTHN